LKYNNCENIIINGYFKSPLQKQWSGIRSKRMRRSNICIMFSNVTERILIVKRKLDLGEIS